MKIVSPIVQIIDKIDGLQIVKKLELIGRVSHRSERAITDDSYKIFIPMLIKLGHTSILEHASVTVEIVTDRGITHEIVRHRLASFTQESQRYIKYSEGVNFIIPSGLTEDIYLTWCKAMTHAEEYYKSMILDGAKPETARSVLPNATASKIYVTANLREWRWIFHERTSKFAHPDFRKLMIDLLRVMKANIPCVFDDIETDDL